jgi:hypothetical protein
MCYDTINNTSKVSLTFIQQTIRRFLFADTMSEVKRIKLKYEACITEQAIHQI